VRTIGVINLVGRGEEHRFSAGNQKLIMAIASQIGAAVENSRLVAESLRRERMVREMELAHDLQLKLLPSLEQFEGYADVAARCAPADSVGGDFYHLFRLPGGRLGVMIGDVSSHGFGAALIMALTMSAVAIHASEGDSPGEVLRRTHRTLIDELETTEMYFTLFYGVIDPREKSMTYANAGHAQAFQILHGGETVRLNATNPPLGIVDLDLYGEETVPWRPGKDLLFLFTDGLSDSLDLGEIRGQQRVLDEAVANRGLPLSDILDLLYRLPAAENAQVDDRTAVLVRV
jgi:sigma-B regulation protein RsbU (phosphoserine phosphatase)